MLILADISGIQDFLFDVREVGGGQAASLRSRSLRIQVIAEVIAARLLRAVSLDDDRLLFCAAGKLAIDATDAPSTVEDAVRKEHASIETCLLRETHGRLRVALAVDRSDSDQAERYRNCMKTLARAKLRAWAPLNSGPWHAVSLVTAEPFDPNQEGEHDERWGKRLAGNAKWLVAREPIPGQSGESNESDVVIGFRVTFDSTQSARSSDLLLTLDLNKLARYVPRTPTGQPIEFLDLSKRSRGAPMLGVLKADVDSLGHAVSQLLDRDSDLASLKKFSKHLDDFFAGELNQLMQGPNSPWADLYTVFSGGDDLLIVGPWDTVLDFAGRLHQRFDQQFGPASKSANPLTLSAAVAIIKPKFPIRLAARQAGDLLELAKTSPSLHADQPKDQFAALGQHWKWQHHNAILSAGKQLADWIDAGIVQRGWLHTLLELALLRRGQIPHRLARPDPPEMATSRLAYHIARNWPKQNDRDEAARTAARRWIDDILHHFDSFSRTTHIDTLYLPAIVRYAMLATRPQGDHE